MFTAEWVSESIKSLMELGRFLFNRPSTVVLFQTHMFWQNKKYILGSGILKCIHMFTVELVLEFIKSLMELGRFFE